MRPVTPAEIDDALSRVYASPEFAERATPALLQLAADLWNAFWLWVWSLLPRVLTGLMGSALPWIIGGLLVAAALWALVRLLGDRVRSPGGGTRPVARQRPTSGAPRDAAEWELAAREAAAHGRFREAAHALYLAAVLRLEERGVLRYDAGKTPGDYRREVRTDPAASGHFDRFVLRFLPVAFGAAEPGADHFDELRSAATRLGVHG
jgi:hypothetical protein